MISYKKVYKLEELNNVSDGILYLSDNQALLDEMKKRNIPCAGFEHDEVKGLKCEHVLIDVDDVDDEVLEGIYMRIKGIPWEIAKTERTVIREFSMDDLDSLFELYAKPGVTQFMEPLFEYEEEKEYESNYIKYIYGMYGYGMWLVFDNADGTLIGRAGIETRETCYLENQAELGFCISPDRWRQGLAYEVCSKIVELASVEYGLTSLIARCDPNNVGSRRLLEKLGFCHEKMLDDGDCLYFLGLQQ